MVTYFRVQANRQISLSKYEDRTLLSYLIFTALFFLFAGNVAFAQDNTLYLMPGIPQANQLNPAFIRPCGTYLELPVISSVRFNIRNTGFGFHDVFHTGTGAQSANYLLDLTKLDKILKPINYFQSETDIDLLGFGFRFKDWYFTFGIANHSDLLLSYPHDIVSLQDGILHTAGKPNSVNLSRMGAEITLWNSIGISAAKVISEGLTAGLRLKYLQGMANAISRRSELLLNSTSDPVSMQAQMNYSIDASFPVIPRYGPTGLVNSLNFDNASNNIAGNYIFNGNRGVAVDAGLVYDPDEITQVTASITDLGFIRWKKNAYNFTTAGEFIFNADDLNQFNVHSGQTDLINALVDSSSKAVTASRTTYFTLMPVKIFAGVSRVILPQLRAGAMTRIEIYNLRVMPSLTFSMNYTPFPAVAASLSYTLMNNKFNQVGAGVALGNRIAQLYLVADNIPLRFTRNVRFPDDTGLGGPFIVPYNARMLSLRMGVNLLFGCNQKEKKYGNKNYRHRDTCPAYW